MLCIEIFSMWICLALLTNANQRSSPAWRWWRYSQKEKHFPCVLITQRTEWHVGEKDRRKIEKIHRASVMS